MKFAEKMLQSGIPDMEVKVLTSVPFLGLELYVDSKNECLLARLLPKTRNIMGETFNTHNNTSARTILLRKYI